MNFTYFDAHAHIHDDKYKNQTPDFFDSLKEKNVGVITVGTDISESRNAINLAEANENIWATIGVHPGDNQKALFLEDEFLELAKSKKCVGIGECGLDYFFLKQDKEKGKIENIDREIDRQRDLFIAQIEFAVKCDLPLMIHGRPSKKDELENPTGMDAYEDIIFILKKMKVKYGFKVRGNMHFFVGDINIAKECLSLGFTFSLGGVLTITEDYRDMVRFLPLESILTETDSPYVTPKIHRGKINSPEYIPAIIDKIAEIKGVTTEEVRLASIANVKRVFNI
jgi:TatD DNase family protein